MQAGRGLMKRNADSGFLFHADNFIRKANAYLAALGRDEVRKTFYADMYAGVDGFQVVGMKFFKLERRSAFIYERSRIKRDGAGTNEPGVFAFCPEAECDPHREFVARPRGILHWGMPRRGVVVCVYVKNAYKLPSPQALFGVLIVIILDGEGHLEREIDEIFFPVGMGADDIGLHPRRFLREGAHVMGRVRPVGRMGACVLFTGGECQSCRNESDE